MRSSPLVTHSRLCVRHVSVRITFPLAEVLGSSDSAAACAALFAGVLATTTSLDFPRPCIIGYGSSPSRCGPWGHIAIGQSWDLPVSDAILSRVMWPTDPGRATTPRIAALLMLRSTEATASAPAVCLSRLNPTPHATAVYASSPSLPPARNTRFRAVAAPYPGWTCTSRSRQLHWRLPLLTPLHSLLQQCDPPGTFPVPWPVL